MAERKVSVRLSVVDGGQFKAELAELGASGNQALGSIGTGAANAAKAVHLNSQQLANLNYQISDIGVSLASGQNPFTVMLQQGSQIVQMFGPGTGILGAIRAIGTGLITFLTNPLNLALLGFSAVTAAAGYFFSAVAGPGEDVNKTLEEQEDIIGRIAGKYGEALPQVQRYADEIDRANRSAELADAPALARFYSATVARIPTAIDRDFWSWSLGACTGSRANRRNRLRRKLAAVRSLAYPGDDET